MTRSTQDRVFRFIPTPQETPHLVQPAHFDGIGSITSRCIDNGRVTVSQYVNVDLQNTVILYTPLHFGSSHVCVLK